MEFKNMPFYDLYCLKCDKEFNIFASMAEKSEKKILCPDCGSNDLKSVYKGASAYVKINKTPECPNRHVCGAGCRHAE